MSELTQTLFIAASIVFDLIITMIFFSVIFERLHHWVNRPFYFLFYLTITLAYLFLRLKDFTWPALIVLNSLEFLAYTFIYKSKFITKIFAAVSLIVFSMLAEIVSNSLFVVLKMIFNFDINSIDLEIYSVTLSKLIKFIMVIIVMLIMRKGPIRANFNNYLCLITVPIISVFIIIALTIGPNGTVNAGIFTNAAIMGILIINFIVFYLLHAIIQTNELREKQTRMETQFMFQEKKYEQTSASFKNISSLIHDTNKHLVYLRECALQNNCEEAIRYVNIAINNIDSSYKRFNTGSLVIDSLVSNAYNTANANKIKFKTDIKIDNSKINIERYDLSVALGNLLDNAIESCMKITNLDDRLISTNIFATDTALVINMLNSAVKDPNARNLSLKTDKENKLVHGYGLDNVNRIAEKYGGSFVTERKESKFEATVILSLLNE